MRRLIHVLFRFVKNNKNVFIIDRIETREKTRHAFGDFTLASRQHCKSYRKNKHKSHAPRSEHEMCVFRDPTVVFTQYALNRCNITLRVYKIGRFRSH